MTDRSMAQRHCLYHVKMFRPSGMSQRTYCRQPETATRKTLRKWLLAYDRNGAQALTTRVPKRCPHNRTSLHDEAIILDYVKHNLGHGAQRIASEFCGVFLGRCSIASCTLQCERYNTGA